MEIVKIKEPIYKIIIAIGIEALFFAGVCWAIGFEYGSFMYIFFGEIFTLALVLYFPICIFYCIVKVRKKIVFDGYNITVVPSLGQKRKYNSSDIKTVKIYQKGEIEVSDKNSNTLFKYNRKSDPKNCILNMLKKSEDIMFSFERMGNNFATDKNRDVLKKYLLTGIIEFDITDSIMISELEEEGMVEEGVVEENVVEEDVEESDYEINRSYSYDSLDEATRARVKRMDIVNKSICITAGILWEIVVLVFIRLLRYFNIFHGIKDLILFVGLLFVTPVLIGKGLAFVLTNRKFNVLKNTFKKYKGEIIDDVDKITTKNKGKYKHIYQFTTLDGEKIIKEGEERLPDDYVIGSRIGEFDNVWYSPCWQTVIASDELVYGKRKKEKVPLKQIVLKHKFATVFTVVFIICLGLKLYSIGEHMVFRSMTKDNAVTVDYDDEDIPLAENEEEWLEYAFFPYFYADGIFDEEDYPEFDVRNYKDYFTKDNIEDMKESLRVGWGIVDRETLLSTTEKLLKYGDRFTYFDNLHKPSIYRVTKEELEADPMDLQMTLELQSNFWRNPYSHMGTYYAYNDAENGVDAWDYCRCIRLYAFGYMCGYISYDEYLRFSQPIMTKLQEEYSSWEELYKSYAYGYMIFAGRNRQEDNPMVIIYLDMVDFIDYDEIPVDFK